jgi:hypothetical protein
LTFRVRLALQVGLGFQVRRQGSVRNEGDTGAADALVMRGEVLGEGSRGKGVEKTWGSAKGMVD